MFKEILSLWKKENLLDQSYQEAEKMLAEVKRLFGTVSQALLSHSSMDFSIKQQDKMVNEMEKNIRRKVLEHLSINPKQDIVASLVLISVVNDIERVGDYIKNIWELEPRYKGFENEEITHKLRDLNSEIEEAFDLTYKSFTESDPEPAKAMLLKHKEFKDKCEGLITEMFESKDIPKNTALCVAFYSRYLKRVSAHLKNLASSLTNPFDHIGYSKVSPPKPENEE